MWMGQTWRVDNRTRGCLPESVISVLTEPRSYCGIYVRVTRYRSSCFGTEDSSSLVKWSRWCSRGPRLLTPESAWLLWYTCLKSRLVPGGQRPLWWCFTNQSWGKIKLRREDWRSPWAYANLVAVVSKQLHGRSQRPAGLIGEVWPVGLLT